MRQTDVQLNGAVRKGCTAFRDVGDTITPSKIVGVTPRYDLAELVDGIGSMDDETERSGRSSRVVGNTLGW